MRDGQHDFVVVASDENGLCHWATKRRLPFDKQSVGPKYTLLSSSRTHEASLAGLPKYHVAGRQFDCNRVFVTEGIMKAEIIAARLHCRVIAIYSTSVDEATLAEVCRLAGEWGTSEFVIAFDADKHELDDAGKHRRPGVLRGEQKLIVALLSITDVFSAEWKLKDGKGLDDLLTDGGTYKLVNRYEPPKPTARAVRPWLRSQRHADRPATGYGQNRQCPGSYSARLGPCHHRTFAPFTSR